MPVNLIDPQGVAAPPLPNGNPAAKSVVTIRRYDEDPTDLDLGRDMPPRLEGILTSGAAGCVYINPKVSVHATAWNARFFLDAVLAHRAWYHWLRQVFGRRSGRNSAKKRSSVDRFWLPGILWIGEAFEPISILDTPVPAGTCVEVHPVQWDRVKNGDFSVPLAQFKERLQRLQNTETANCCYAAPGFTAVTDHAATEFVANLEPWQRFWRKRCRWHLKDHFGPLKQASDPHTRRLFFEGVVIVEPDSIRLGTIAEDHLTRVKALAYAQLGGWNQFEGFLESIEESPAGT